MHYIIIYVFYNLLMIENFKCKETKKIFEQQWSSKLPRDIQRQAMKKLWMLHAATALEELKVPPSNNLEKLQGSRKGQYSIRINKQWRVCFVWKANNIHNVEIVDYH